MWLRLKKIHCFSTQYLCKSALLKYFWFYLLKYSHSFFFISFCPSLITPKKLPSFYPIYHIWLSYYDTIPFSLFPLYCLLINKRQLCKTTYLLKTVIFLDHSSVLILDNVMIKFSSDQISVLSLELPYLYKHFLLYLSQRLEV